MITLQEIRDAVANRHYDALRDLWQEAAITSIEKCDFAKKTTLRCAILGAVILQGMTGAEDSIVLSMLASIDRGIHPYDDPATMQKINALTYRQAQSEKTDSATP